MVEPVISSKQASKAPTLRQYYRLAFFVLLGVALFRWSGRESSGPAQGSTAKPFTLPVVGGERTRVSLDDYRGNPVVIEVFADWCGACRQMAPRFAELAEAKRSKPAHFLGIAVDGSLDDLKALRNAWRIPFEVALGNAEFSSNYRISVLPTIILLDAEGKISRVSTGVTSVSKIDGWLSELGAPRL